MYLCVGGRSARRTIVALSAPPLRTTAPPRPSIHARDIRPYACAPASARLSSIVIKRGPCSRRCCLSSSPTPTTPKDEDGNVLSTADEKRDRRADGTSKNDDHDDDDILKRKAKRIRRKLEEKEVPSTSFARMVGFGGMAAKIAMQAASEAMVKKDEGEDREIPKEAQGPRWMSDAVADTIASELCRMRGAALKIGQILSLQDSQNLPAPLAKALERVRTEANIMPQWQLQEVMSANLGSDWRSKFKDFEDEPVAAASIGQVHQGETPEGVKVAIKVQYPGVAAGVDADMANLERLLTFGQFVPKGLFLDRVIATAKEELALECDYVREGKNQEEFRKLLNKNGDKQKYNIPAVHWDLSGKQVLTMDWVEGEPVDRLSGGDKNDWAPQELRDSVASRLLGLVLRELFEFRMVQSDPNWSNFLFDRDTDTLHLIDFGATNEYPEAFVEEYLDLVWACANKDRNQILRKSKEIGFLCGRESPAMIQAHVEAAYIMGEPFSRDEPFDFQTFKHGERMAEQGRVFLSDRLVPPPKEIYTLHRKLFGAVSTCVKLRAKFNCRAQLMDVAKRSNGDGRLTTNS